MALTVIRLAGQPFGDNGKSLEAQIGRVAKGGPCSEFAYKAMMAAVEARLIAQPANVRKEWTGLIHRALVPSLTRRPTTRREIINPSILHAVACEDCPRYELIAFLESLEQYAGCLFGEDTCAYLLRDYQAALDDTVNQEE
ncbi:MAG: hypothetical protein CEO22_142 [Candidatus Berkelbacteria bacterium Gr01-1014_85]|uniref:Uncharacterized protein n=1 Tax=Candidatus Berkelbacteria bacterium Gr01-1014_85 TaxID=2017150 RepID=A0A554JD68_9BACT|nr:MAG: hypothetical protein CEO22_142 [Candidatus Berkelbacteria bacterium Gr01-1014_85]